MFLLSTLLLALGHTGQPPQPPQPPPAFAMEQAKVVTFYYKSPDPLQGPKLLKELIKKENVEHPWFAQRGHVLVLMASILGDIGTGQPKVVREYEASFAGATTAGRKVILRALTNCGDKETLARADAWLGDDKFADVRPELQGLKKHLENPRRQHVRDRAAATPDDLDLLWGNFFISGEYAPVSRILDVFDQPDAQANEVMKRVARWSLGSNLQQHPRLAELVREHSKERAAGSRKVIEELTGAKEP